MPEPNWQDAIKHPAFRGHGAKWVLRKWLNGFLNVPHESFVEPFCQTASILLTRPRSSIEVINDLNGDVTNFFEVLRSNRHELIYQIQLTPWAIEEYRKCWEPSNDPLERARRFYARSHMSMRMATSQQKNPGFRRQKRLSTKSGNGRMSHAPNTFKDISHLWLIADRLLGVQIENGKAQWVIKTYDEPTAIQFCDPPYPHVVRKRRDDYAKGCEMSDREHEDLLSQLKKSKSMIAISSYRKAIQSKKTVYNEIYLDMLSDWEMHTKTTDSQNSKREEVVFLNPALMNAREVAERQLKRRYPLLERIKNE